MKTKHLFWGILFISIGLLWLLEHFMQIYVEWDYVWKLWPVVIILWGASLMIGNQIIKSVVVQLLPSFLHSRYLHLSNMVLFMSDMESTGQLTTIITFTVMA